MEIAQADLEARGLGACVLGGLGLVLAVNKQGPDKIPVS